MAATSEDGIAFIGRLEGKVLLAYRDIVGVLTIGHGHTNLSGVPPKVTPGMRITNDEALEILRKDMAKFDVRVSKALPNVPQYAHDGGSSFDMNTGGIFKASWVKFYLAGAMEDSKRRFAMWNKAGGRVVKGLVSRRNAEISLTFHGSYGEATSIPSISHDDSRIKEYQTQLKKLGYYTGAIDGFAGSNTNIAVMMFQAEKGLAADGVVGPATRATLARAVSAKLSTKVAIGGGGATGAGAGGSEVFMGPVAPESIEIASQALVWGVGVVVAILATSLVWRYRGVILRKRSPT